MGVGGIAGEPPQTQTGHLQNPHPSCQRLAHALHEVVCLRTGEDDAVPFLRLVNDPFHRGEELRCALHFVDDEREDLVHKMASRQREAIAHRYPVLSNMGIEFPYSATPTPWLHGPFPCRKHII